MVIAYIPNAQSIVSLSSFSGSDSDFAGVCSGHSASRKSAQKAAMTHRCDITPAKINKRNSRSLEDSHKVLREIGVLKLSNVPVRLLLLIALQSYNDKVKQHGGIFLNDDRA